MRNLDAFLADLNRECALPALVAAITDRRGLTALGATGVRRVGEPEAVDAGDPFHIGSVTKPITSAMVASLVGDGLLGFDSIPAQVLGIAVHPVLRDVPLLAYLAHQAGLAAFTDDAEWTAFAHLTGTRSAQMRAFSEAALAAPPGEVGYSNAGFAVAAAMAEQATGSTWAELLSARVFAPLGMDSARAGWPPPGAPAGHWRGPDGMVAVAAPDLPAALGPAGDLHMNATDLAAFGRSQLAALGQGDPVTEVYEAMGFQPGVSKGTGFAGSAGTYTALLSLRVAEDRAIVVFTNAGDDDDVLGHIVLPALVGL